MTRKDALILMAKAPLPGQVKTRLCPPLTKGGAAALYACLLEDTAMEMTRLKRVHRYLFYSPPGSGRFFRRDPFSRFEALPQSGADLGERMAAAFETAFTRGFARTVLVGADCPVLSATLVRAAFRELASSADAVFGPSDDGGFYLIALSSHIPSLFRGVHWGTGTVLSEVSRRCREAGVPLLPPPPRVRHRHRRRCCIACPLGANPLLPGLPPNEAVAHLPRGRISFRPIPRSTTSVRRMTSLISFAGPATSNDPVSPRRSAPSPRNRVFGNTVFFSLRPLR